MYFYSASNNGFYISGFNDSAIPDDVVKIKEAIFIEYSETPPSGKMRIAGDNGLPTWGDTPLPLQEDIATTNEEKKLTLRAVADDEMAWRQDAVDAGIATDEETAALAEWKKFRVLLMRVDTADPGWPTSPGQQAS